MKKKILSVLLVLLFIPFVMGQSGASRKPLKIQEEDGTPAGFPATLKVTNGVLTNNGDGTFSLSVTGNTTPSFNTSADLAAILSDETGTGAAVFGDNPTFSDMTVTGDINPLVIGTTGEVGLKCDPIYGTGNKFVFKAPSSIPANVVITLPHTDGTGALASNGSGTASWVNYRVMEDANGSSPTAAGYVKYNRTTDRLEVGNGAGTNYIGDKTETIFCFNIHYPEDTCDNIKKQLKRACTLTKVTMKCDGTTNVVGRLYEVDGDGDPSDQVGVESSDWTVTTTETEDTSFNNATFDAGDYISWDTTSVSGAPVNFNCTAEGYWQ